MTEQLYNNILYMDSNEKNPLTKLHEFISLGLNVNRIDLQALGLGDYYYKHDNGEINIERKTQNDFDGSVSNGHVFDQANKMMQWASEEDKRYAYILFIGETDIMNDYAQMAMRGRIGAIGSLTGRGVPVIPIDSEESFNYLVYKFIKMLHEDKFGKMRYVDLFKYKNPDVAKLGMTEKILRFVTGVGAQRARDIAEVIELEIKIKSKDPEVGDYDALLSVSGIGEKTAERIYDELERDEEVEFKEDMK